MTFRRLNAYKFRLHVYKLGCACRNDCWSFYVFCACCSAHTVCNAAPGKVAYQISEQFVDGRPYPALFAVDGNRIASLPVGGCAVTGSAVDPWWCVDLGYHRTVLFVALTTRKHVLKMAFHDADTDTAARTSSRGSSPTRPTRARFPEVIHMAS